MYRPFLSYSELGSMLDEVPTKLHDAVSSVLGLDELSAAEKTLAGVRLEREKAKKEALDQRDAARGSDREPRRSSWPRRLLDRAPSARLQGAPGCARDASCRSSEGCGVLQRVLALDAPDVDVRTRRPLEIRSPRLPRRLSSQARSPTSSCDPRDLIDEALHFSTRSLAETCPVCETPSILTDEWRERGADSRRRATPARSITRRRSGCGDATKAGQGACERRSQADPRCELRCSTPLT